MTVGAPTRFAVDSNVIAYLFAGDVAKADRAEALVVQGNPRPVISTQVMNEVTLVMSRKMGLGWIQVLRFMHHCIRAARRLRSSLQRRHATRPGHLRPADGRQSVSFTQVTAR
jgi:predicted nucleic acid-binding protein